MVLVAKGRRGKSLGVTTMLTEKDRTHQSLARILDLKKYAAGATAGAS